MGGRCRCFQQYIRYEFLDAPGGDLPFYRTVPLFTRSTRTATRRRIFERRPRYSSGDLKEPRLPTCRLYGRARLQRGKSAEEGGRDRRRGLERRPGRSHRGTKRTGRDPAKSVRVDNRKVRRKVLPIRARLQRPLSICTIGRLPRHILGSARQKGLNRRRVLLSWIRDNE